MKNTEDKTISIISYFGPVGFVIAFIMYDKNKTEFNTFHLRQSVGVNAVVIAAYIAVHIFSWFSVFFMPSFIPTFVIGGVYVIAIYLYISGIMNASNGKKKYLPIGGEKFEEFGSKIIK